MISRCQDDRTQSCVGSKASSLHCTITRASRQDRRRTGNIHSTLRRISSEDVSLADPKARPSTPSLTRPHLQTSHPPLHPPPPPPLTPSARDGTTTATTNTQLGDLGPQGSVLRLELFQLRVHGCRLVAFCLQSLSQPLSSLNRCRCMCAGDWLGLWKGKKVAYLQLVLQPVRRPLQLGTLALLPL